MEQIKLIQPDDWHVHLRDGQAMQHVAGFTAAQFGRAIIMPNLTPPVTHVEHAIAYRERILSSLEPGTKFDPLMTLYLTDNTTESTVHAAAESPHVVAFKYYPAGATTNSESGVTHISKVHGALQALAGTGMPLLVHGEVTSADVDVFDRESVFIEEVLRPLLASIPTLRVVLEHITTQDAVNFVTAAGPNVAATITPQHLLFNRNALFQGGLRPHHYCLPVLKREQHRRALVAAATSGDAKFFLGTDSAPHAQSQKESACGCAGIFSAHAALELYTHVFETQHAMDKLEAFASTNGPAFYQLPVNQQQITLTRRPWTVPERYELADNETLIPFLVGETLNWKMETGHG